MKNIQINNHRRQADALTAGLLAILLFALGVIVLLAFWHSPLFAADYYILRDSSGRVTLTDLPPSQGQVAVKHYEWKEVSDEEVRAAQQRELTFWLGLKIEELASETKRLAEAIDRQSKIENLKSAEPPTFISGSTTSVTVRPVIVVPKGK